MLMFRKIYLHKVQKDAQEAFVEVSGQFLEYFYEDAFESLQMQPHPRLFPSLSLNIIMRNTKRHILHTLQSW